MQEEQHAVLELLLACCLGKDVSEVLWPFGVLPLLLPLRCVSMRRYSDRPGDCSLWHWDACGGSEPYNILGDAGLGG